MTFTSKKTDKFIKKLNKLPTFLICRIEDLGNKVMEYPFVGKPLFFPFFREKRLGSLRIYFLIYENKKEVLFIDISTKKDQQEIIDKIREYIRESYNHLLTFPFFTSSRARIRLL